MKVNQTLKKTGFLLLVILFLPAMVYGADVQSIEGKIGGADCVISKGDCNMGIGDPRLKLERDFVLSTTDGKYYFLTNISRLVKERFINKPVQITGKVRDNAIYVLKIAVKNNQEYLTAWDWDTIKRKMNHRTK